MTTTLPDCTKDKRLPVDTGRLALEKAWHKSAPGSVRKAFKAGKQSKGWAAWMKHLAKQNRAKRLDELTPGKRSPLCWALPQGADSRGTPDVLNRLASISNKVDDGNRSAEVFLLDWLAESAGADVDAGYALETLGWCRAMPRLAVVLPPDQWWGLLDHLLGTVSDAAGLQLDDQPLVHQLLAGELPLALAYLFPEITPCRKLAPVARRALSAGLVDLLDGQGLPHAGHLELLRPLLASWTRCRAMGRELSKPCLSAAAKNQYEWLVRAAMRLSRGDGSQPLSDNSSGAWDKDLFAAALRLGGDEDDRKIAVLALPSGKKSKAKGISRGALPEAASHSQWAATTMLRSGWERSDPLLTVVWAGQSVRFELAAERHVLWSGRWGLDVSQDGKPLAPICDWDEVCWVSDDDIDYLELEIELDTGLKVQRQMALAREDGFLFLADAILGDRAGLQYRSSLPLASGISFRPDGQCREGFLEAGKPVARVMPLALPEWRNDARGGSLQANQGCLELSQSSQRHSIYAPLFVDLSRRRMSRRITWRRLTVAEQLRIQPSDVAAGYRVALGKEQWLIYRSLGEARNRTLLGHNLSSEMLIARFDADGEVETLVEIE
jgi:hypothetical protein